MPKAESGYSTFDRKLLVVHLAVRQFCCFLEEGHRYLFTVIDHSTHWPEDIPMENAISASCTLALLSGWITRFGIPEHITSDRGTTFTSQFSFEVQLEGLSWVILGLSTTPKATLDISAAEMVYGDPLVVHAEFFSVRNLLCQYPEPTSHCGKIYPMPPDLQALAKQHAPTDLHSSTHVFLCNNTSKPPLTPPYTSFPCDPSYAESIPS
ncbi:uncharacterized protein [Palaemon carinicauda]|uniref:uncharacterized protein n=1 Tax=Palaemon carinicauda TaxID=392227 RepID=UPI0035B5C7B3